MIDRLNELSERLSAVLPSHAVLTGPAALEQARSDWSSIGTPLAVTRPTTTDQVAAIVRECAAMALPVVPWGGKTGLVDGAFADGSVAMLFDRMSTVEQIDPLGRTVTVQAGCSLAALADAIEPHQLFLPIDFGARGSATVGGVLATNAGGNQVIRYGMARDHVLGLEVVLADGTVVCALNHCIKNNTGYDLKQWFVGSEGTLGIITRATLRLRPKPLSNDAAFIGCSQFSQLVGLLRHVDAKLGGSLTAFEVMWPEFFDLVTTAPAKGRSPLAASHAYYVLIEAQGADPERDTDTFVSAMSSASELKLLDEAAIASSGSDREAFWALRDDVSQSARHWPIFSFDVSLRILDMESYIEEVRAALRQSWGEAATLTVFGHLGDGNLHLVVGVGSRSPAASTAVEEIVYGGIRSRGGSISAEHGIGIAKRPYLAYSRSAEEIDLMRKMKTLLDPQNILNPGKLLPPP